MGLIRLEFRLAPPRLWTLIGCVGPENARLLQRLHFKSALAESAVLLRIIEGDSPYADFASSCIRLRERSCRSARLRAEIIELETLDIYYCAG